MARSQMLKDLVVGQADIDNILSRLKIILYDLDNEPISKWVNGELEGYDEDSTLPQYRIIQGHPIGNFVVNYVIQYTNKPVPLRTLIDDEKYNRLITLDVRLSNSAIKNILNSENKENFAKVIDTDFCHFISTNELQITTMNIRFASNQLDDIVSKVKSKLIDIILELEKQFDNLDELDIKEQVEQDKSRKKEVIYNIQNIIYDGSIEVGDGNRIGKSRIGHFFSGGKK